MRRAEEEEHAWLKDEKAERTVEEARLKLEEEGLQLNSEDGARLVEEATLESEQ